MTRSRVWIPLVALAALLGAVPLGAIGQEADFRFQSYNPAVRVLRDYTLQQGDTARQVVVIGGDATINGHVSEDVVVVLGKVQLGSTAVIDGTFVAVAGTVEIAEGAKVNRDFVVVGDAQIPSSFSPAGEHVVVGIGGFGNNLRSIVPWFMYGLLLGRPIVPWLEWVWIVAAVFFFLNLCVNVLFDTPVRASATTLRTSPLSAFMAGLLVLLLAGPVCLLLVVSVIGIAVIPFLLCAIVVAAVIGRVAFARWIGMSMVRQDDPADRPSSMRSFAIGSAVMCVCYMIPFVGLMLWALAGVFGLGAATLAFQTAYRRENPKPPKKAVPPPPLVPSPPAETADRPGFAAARSGFEADGSALETGSSGLQAGDHLQAGADRVEPAAAYDAGLRPEADLRPEGRSYLTNGTGAPEAAAYEGDLRPEGRSYLTNGTAVSWPKAVFVERLAALVLDAIVIMIIAQLIGLNRHGGDSGDRLMIFLALAYHVGFWTWRGTTPGGMICQLRVVRIDGKPLEFAESLVRGLTGIISVAVAGLGFLWILRDPERQAWHDRVAGTYVVKVPRAYPA